MNKLLRFSLLSILSILCGVAHADLPQTATWDFTNAGVVDAAVALSGSTEAGTIAAVENNGLLLTIEANGQTIRNNSNSIQTGNPVVFKVPVQGKKDVVTVVGYPGYFAYSIAGTDATEATTTYTATATDVTQGYVEIVSKGQYIISISVTQNEDSNPQPIAQDITGTWDFGNADVMAATVALSASTQAGEVEAVEKNGLKMIVEANGASFRANGNNIQVATGAVFKIPVMNAGDLVTVKGYPGYSKYTIGNSADVLTEEMWRENLDKAIRIQHFICDQVYESRNKDYENEFRNATFRNDDEKIAVIGKIEDVGFVQQIREETEEFVKSIQDYIKNHLS